MLAALAAAAAGALTVACTAGSDEVPVTIGVSAAPSLASALTELIGVFEEANPGVRVHLELGRSTVVAERLGSRTDVNVFASASDDAMELAEEQGSVTDVEVFARNHVVLAVPSGNPEGVTGLSDLSREDLRVGLCDRSVPCGAAATVLLGEAGVEPVVDSHGAGSRALAAQLGDNELDVGIIYRTDVAASVGWVSQVEVDERERELTEAAGATRYLLARVPGGEEDEPDVEAAREAGEEFRALVISDRGRRALENAGLQPFTG